MFKISSNAVSVYEKRIYGASGGKCIISRLYYFNFADILRAPLMSRNIFNSLEIDFQRFILYLDNNIIAR